MIAAMAAPTQAYWAYLSELVCGQVYVEVRHLYAKWPFQSIAAIIYQFGSHCANKL